jgi:aspartyl-tRNA(Asn)/glutamyl-tRNA(Gln) amidotransferase subunit A
MPYVAKEMIATGLAAASWGCLTPPVGTDKPATLIDRLGASGACLIGTSEMTELAYEPSGLNPVRGNVGNPWNFDMVPGGSSSGSAALVAAGCCFAALGSDTGGSVRIPAHCCGVSALKPTWGSLPLDGTMPLAPTLDTIGIFARSAADIALFWTALSRGPVASVSVGGVLLEDAFAEADAEVAMLCRRAVGAIEIAIEARTGVPEEADRYALLVLQAEASRTHAACLGDSRIDATLRKRLGKGLTIDPGALAAAIAAREAIRDAFLQTVFGKADVVFLPVMPIKTPRYEEVDPASATFNPSTLYALSRFTRFVNYLGLPALSVPAGFDSRGMPVGIQIVGRPGSDALLLSLGMKLQSKTDWHGRVPTAIASDIAAEEGMAA